MQAFETDLRGHVTSTSRTRVEPRNWTFSLVSTLPSSSSSSMCALATIQVCGKTGKLTKYKYGRRVP